MAENINDHLILYTCIVDSPYIKWQGNGNKFGVCIFRVTCLEQNFKKTTPQGQRHTKKFVILMFSSYLDSIV